MLLCLVQPQDNLSCSKQLNLDVANVLSRPTLKLPGSVVQQGVKSPEWVANTIWAVPATLDGVVVALELGPKHLEVEPWLGS